VQLLAHFAKQTSLDKLWHKPLHLGGAEEEIDFRKYIGELRLVALDHAADGNDGLAASRRLETRGFDHRVDRFLLGGVDEAARIDDDDFQCLLSFQGAERARRQR